MINFNFSLLLIFFFFYFLVLVPRLKLKYHENNNWKTRFINETRKAITNLYENQYAPVTNVIETDNHPEDDLFSHIYKKC